MRTVFDQVLGGLAQILISHLPTLQDMRPVYVYRDLNGRVRLIVDEKYQNDPAKHVVLNDIVNRMHETLSPHTYRPEESILWEYNIASVVDGQVTFPLEGCPGIHVIDRLAVEGDWSNVAPVAMKSPRVVFFPSKVGLDVPAPSR